MSDFSDQSKFYSIRNTLIWVSFFSLAMGMIESTVVIYLREIYYPQGFVFPLKSFEGKIAITEIIREGATLLMLVSIGALTGRSFTERFAYFIYSFAIWDIFYYLFLALLIEWPGSLMTWDILFLIPCPWVGPVITPILLSILMILFASLIIYFNRYKIIRIAFREWLVLILGSLVVIYSFLRDYATFILQQFSIKEVLLSLNQEGILTHSKSYVPLHFDWWLFCFGYLIIGFGIFLYSWRNRKTHAD